MTLTSNSPCEFNEENKCSKFRVHLGQVIELVGKYEVALCEIFYPGTLCNVSANECFVTKNVVTLFDKKENGKVHDCALDEGNTVEYCLIIIDKKSGDEHHHVSKHSMDTQFYHNISDFLLDFNTRMSFICNAEIDPKTQKIKMTCHPTVSERETITYKFSPTLESILGFLNNSEFSPGFIYRADMPCDLRKGIPPMLTVCSDLIGDQIINNGHDRVLRTFHISPEKYSYGFQKKESFSKLFFLPILKKKIEYVDIYIKEGLQTEASFTHGTLKVVLLFKRVV